MSLTQVNDVTKVVGNTPLVRLNKIGSHLKANIYGKLEYLNPGGSVKDRVAFQIIEDAEEAGLLKPGGTIVEATSGNTGMGLALAAAVKGYKCVFVMPDKMSQEKIKGLRAFGAKVVITPTEVEPEDPRSYYCVSRRIADETPGAFYANQYHNQSNPKAHYKTTGPEIWKQTDGKIDVFISSAGTGGTISGTGRYLKEQNPDLQVVGVDPVGSIFYDYFHTGKITQAYGYKVEGFGEDFLPTTMNFDVVDDIIRVTDKECFDYTRRLVREEGLYCGGSSGGAVAGAIKYAEKLDRPLNIVVILCDSATRYLSKIFDDEWMRGHGFLGGEFGQETISDLLGSKASNQLYTASIKHTVREVVALMRDNGVSQLPVMSGERVMGVINEGDVLEHLLSSKNDSGVSIESLVETNFAIVEPTNRVHLIGQFFTQGRVVMVMDQGRLIGIITKIDYIDFMSKII